jgi:hypothetical protein
MSISPLIAYSLHTLFDNSYDNAVNSVHCSFNKTVYYVNQIAFYFYINDLHNNDKTKNITYDIAILHFIEHNPDVKYEILLDNNVLKLYKINFTSSDTGLNSFVLLLDNNEIKYFGPLVDQTIENDKTTFTFYEFDDTRTYIDIIYDKSNKITLKNIDTGCVFGLWIYNNNLWVSKCDEYNKNIVDRELENEKLFC